MNGPRSEPVIKTDYYEKFVSTVTSNLLIAFYSNGLNNLLGDDGYCKKRISIQRF